MISDTNSENTAALPLHPVPPLPPLDAWTLLLSDGERRLSLDMPALARLPHTEVSDQFTCIEGWSAGPLRWGGVRLSTLLATLAASDAPYLAVSAPDFRAVLPRDSLPEETLLATALDGRPLPVEHGGPLRLVVPGGVCYQSVKWVRAIELSDSAAGDSARAIALGRLRDRRT